MIEIQVLVLKTRMITNLDNKSDKNKTEEHPCSIKMFINSQAEKNSVLYSVQKLQINILDHTIKVESKLEIPNFEEYYSGLTSAANESGLFSRVRKYLNFCKQQEYSVSDEEMMQNFIVETRKADEKIGIPQLHNILILGRSFAIARGHNTAKLEFLEEARDILKKINDRSF